LYITVLFYILFVLAAIRLLYTLMLTKRICQYGIVSQHLEIKGN